MTEANAPNPARRRRKRRPKWQRVLRHYWPLARLILLLAGCIMLIVFTVRAFTSNLQAKTQGTAQQETAQTSQPQTPQDTDAADGSQQSSDLPAPLVADGPVSDAPQTAATDFSSVIAQADAMAAGYDYQGAIELLKSQAGYESSQAAADKVAAYEQADRQLVVYEDMSSITHVFFHSLIVDPARAFDEDYTRDGYNLYMTTIDEFNAILQNLYDRDFVLVSPYDIASEVTDEQGTHFAYGTIRLPEGKKPFMMSQDDLNYYGYMVGAADGSAETPVFATKDGDGFASRIVIGDDGYPTCEYMDENGNVTYGDYDLVPLLERFIQAHPDFSYHGARAVLAVTGYEGVFGYRTKPSYEAAMGSEAYQKEVEDAKAVAQCLRDHGWDLASHSYGHPPYGAISAERVEIDSDKWEDTVQPIIGETDILVYPHGSDIAGTESYTFDNPKYAALYQDGYRYFFNVDSTVAWHQMDGDYFRGNRRNLDGYRMYHNPDLLEDLFEVSDVMDPARPLPVPDIG